MSVTAPGGFAAAGVAAGIKGSGLLDLAVVMATEDAAPAVGVFTQNAAAAAPVVLSRRNVAGGRARAVVLNSGCANAATGMEGEKDAARLVEAVAGLVGCAADEVLACSTGPIGRRLPLARIERALPDLIEKLSPAGGNDAAEAILTTDTAAKTVVVEGSGFTVGGMGKGAGMLRPNLATMLALITTDAVAEPVQLQRILSATAAVTFNSLNIDGCESTNDTVLLIASGASGRRPPGDDLGRAVEEACRQLARAMAADAEGASRVVTMHVSGAADSAAARHLGRLVADSALVRASFYGRDPNWGRILAALGSAGIDPGGVSVAYEKQLVAREGVAVAHDTEAVAAMLTGDFAVDIVVGTGSGRAEIITTDLTPEYVRFNGERS
jgi:glutamate N-acetyltransferase / amino-acid N-acetyltransferase